MEYVEDRIKPGEVIGGILAIAVVVCLAVIAGFVSMKSFDRFHDNTGLQPLNEVMRDVAHEESRISYRDNIYTRVFNEDDLYEGWGKVAIQECVMHNYFKADVGQIIVEALWSDEAAQSRGVFIKKHKLRTWFEPYVDDKIYKLKSVYAVGRFCVRFSTDITDEDETAIMERFNKSTGQEVKQI